MPRVVECPKCNTDISHTYEVSVHEVGVLDSGWRCDACDVFIQDIDPFEEDYRNNFTGDIQS